MGRAGTPSSPTERSKTPQPQPKINKPEVPLPRGTGVRTLLRIPGPEPPARARRAAALPRTAFRAGSPRRPPGPALPLIPPKRLPGPHARLLRHEESPRGQAEPLDCGARAAASRHTARGSGHRAQHHPGARGRRLPPGRAGPPLTWARDRHSSAAPRRACAAPARPRPALTAAAPRARMRREGWRERG